VAVSVPLAGLGFQHSWLYPDRAFAALAVFAGRPARR
jgi:hypothetical protein